MRKHVKEFTVPRGRVPTEVSRAFQDILISLRNLEAALADVPEHSEELSSLRASLTDLERSVSREQPQQVRVVREQTTEISYSSTFGEAE